MRNKAVNKGIIYFCKPNGRLLSDSLDTYNWLLAYNVKLAEEYKTKAGNADYALYKANKALKNQTTYALKELKWDKKPLKEVKKEVKTKKRWWEFFK